MLSRAAQCTRNTRRPPREPDHWHTQISQTGNNSARKLASLFGKNDANLHAGYSCVREESVGIPLQSALVCGDFKLIHFAETDRYDLYNLRDSISESHDLSQEQPEKLLEMINLLNANLKDKAALHPRTR